MEKKLTAEQVMKIVSEEIGALTRRLNNNQAQARSLDFDDEVRAISERSIASRIASAVRS